MALMALAMLLAPALVAQPAAAAVVVGGDAIRGGFDSNAFGGNDDGTWPCVSQSAGTPPGCTPQRIPIGFSANFVGNTFDSVFLNNNGNLTLDMPLATYTPFPLLTTNQQIIAPFFSDVDTRVGSTVTFGAGSVGGQPAWAATWPGVGCYNVNQTVLDYFQVVLINRSDVGPGDFDIEYNYNGIQWDSGQASGGDSQCQHGFSARVGFNSGTGTSFEMTGSGTPGYFLDTSPTGLIHSSRNSTVPGRYVFQVRNGAFESGGTISGTIDANSIAPGNGIGGAFVELTDSQGFTHFTQADANGQYTISGLAAGTYTGRAFPPQSNDGFMPGTFGPGTLTPNGTLTLDGILLGPEPPPGGSSIGPVIYTGGSGIPVVYWGQDLQLTTEACAGATSPGFPFLQYHLVAEDGTVVRSGAMTEQPGGPAGSIYTANVSALRPLHGNFKVEIQVHCPSDPAGQAVLVEWDVYVDPSGTVQTVGGQPIQGATVTLLRSDNQSGPFEALPNGSSFMSLPNRQNPMLTDANGFFGWDVFAGFYQVQASAPGCVSPTDPTSTTVTTQTFQVPPEATGLVLVLDCSGTSSGGGPGTGGPGTGATPELDSLFLFGSGGLGLGGYALLRWRARRRDEDEEDDD